MAALQNPLPASFLFRLTTAVTFSLSDHFPACGCYASIPPDRYHALGHLSSHRLGLFKRSPAHYYYHSANPSPATAAQAFGEMLHLAVLEPARFEAEVVTTDASSRTKAYAALVEEHGPARVASTTEHAALLNMRDALAAHPAARVLTDAPHRELTIVFEHETVCDDTGECRPVACKSRLDLFHWPDCRIVDVKTARDASPRAFGRAAHDYGYALQGAFYAHAAAAATGQPPDAFEVVFVVVEKEPPYAVGVYAMDHFQLARAQAEVQHLIAQYAGCERDDHWPAYSADVEPLTLPPWA